MHTGDLATMDADGYVNITGRIKDMLIRGGENVYPREIEEFLFTHPDVLDVQVIGVPDVKYGEEIMAWIRLRPGAVELTARRRAGVRRRQARPLQDPPIRPDRRGVPDDGQRQGPQGRDAPDVDRAARAPRRRRNGDTPEIIKLPLHSTRNQASTLRGLSRAEPVGAQVVVRLVPVEPLVRLDEHGVPTAIAAGLAAPVGRRAGTRLCRIFPAG